MYRKDEMYTIPIVTASIWRVSFVNEQDGK